MEMMLDNRAATPKAPSARKFAARALFHSPNRNWFCAQKDLWHGVCVCVGVCVSYHNFCSGCIDSPVG